MLFVGQVSGLAETFHIGVYSDTIDVINVTLCWMVLLIVLYLFMPLSVILTTFQVHSNVEDF